MTIATGVASGGTRPPRRTLAERSATTRRKIIDAVVAVIAEEGFAQASAQFDPDYHLRPKIGQPWMGSGKNPTGIDRTSGEGDGESRTGGGLHAEQHYEYHRHLKVGDVLTATTTPGKTWEKQGRRAGKLRFSESITEYRDQNGDLVITARSVGVQTEKAASQD